MSKIKAEKFQFYRKNWKDDLKRISNDNGIGFYPFLSAEADSLESRYRQEVPMSEIIKLEFDFLK